MKKALQPIKKLGTYLSVDVDFWNISDLSQAQKELYCILEAIKRHNIPYFICQDHSQLLRHIKYFPKIRHLVNVDTHSDFADLYEKANIGKELRFYGSRQSVILSLKNLNCGMWVNYVKQRKRSHYTWITHDPGYGRCHAIHDPFDDEETKKMTGWKDCKIVEYNGQIITDFDYASVVGVGFALSYDYIEPITLPLIKQLHDFSGQSFVNFHKRTNNTGFHGCWTEQDFDRVDEMCKMGVFKK